MIKIYREILHQCRGFDWDKGNIDKIWFKHKVSPSECEQIPKFKNEDEEREFWATHDSTEFINWNQAERVTFSNLKPSVKKISLRLPESMLEELKLLANKRDVPYQSLLKIFLAERIEKELGVR
jgi:predicted DNA binding CopG/RHH family protein